MRSYFFCSCFLLCYGIIYIQSNSLFLAYSCLSSDKLKQSCIHYGNRDMKQVYLPPNPPGPFITNAPTAPCPQKPQLCLLSVWFYPFQKVLRMERSSVQFRALLSLAQLSACRNRPCGCIYRSLGSCYAESISVHTAQFVHASPSRRTFALLPFGAVTDKTVTNARVQISCECKFFHWSEHPGVES